MARFRRPTEKTPTDWKGIVPTPRKAYRRLPQTAPAFLREMEEDALYAAALDMRPETEAGLDGLRAVLADFNAGMERRCLDCRLVFRTAVTIGLDGGPKGLSEALDLLPKDGWHYRVLLGTLWAMRPCDEHQFSDYAKTFWWQFGRHTKKGRLAKLESFYRENMIVAREKAEIAAGRALFMLERRLRAMIREDADLPQNTSLFLRRKTPLPPVDDPRRRQTWQGVGFVDGSGPGRWLLLRNTNQWIWISDKDSPEVRAAAAAVSAMPAFVEHHR